MRQMSRHCDEESIRNFRVAQNLIWRKDQCMTLQNRIDPAGEIHAVPQRGTLMGNRGGCLHDGNRQLTSRKWVSGRWIICVLEFRGRKRTLMSPGCYTELFFLDEVTALSAGHRPCFECQRKRALEFKGALVGAGLLGADAKADDIDDLVSAEIRGRMTGNSELRTVDPADFPDGAMFRTRDTIWLKWSDRAFKWTFDGYEASGALPNEASCLTPSSVIAAFNAGYRPDVHQSLKLLET